MVHGRPRSRRSARQARRTRRRKAAIRRGSFRPAPRSTPEETSTSGAPDRRIASATFQGSSPPARNHGRCEACARPAGPSRTPRRGRRAARRPRGGLASNIRWSATASKARRGVEVGGLGDRQSLDHAGAGARADLAAARAGVSRPCSWIRSGAQRLRRSRRARRRRDRPSPPTTLRPAPRRRGQPRGGLGRDVARALGEEHEADVGRPAVQRRVHRLGRRQSADLGFDRLAPRWRFATQGRRCAAARASWHGVLRRRRSAQDCTLPSKRISASSGPLRRHRPGAAPPRFGQAAQARPCTVVSA